MPIRPVLVTSILVALLIASPASALAATWTTPAKVGDNFTGRPLGVTGSAAADGTFEFGVAAGSSNPNVIHVNTFRHAPGTSPSASTWVKSGAPIGDVSMTGDTAFAQNANGDAIIAWKAADQSVGDPSAMYNVLARVRHGASGAWGPKLLISDPTNSAGSDSPVVSIDAAGRAIVAFRQGSRLLVRSSTAGAGAWSGLSTVVSSGSYPTPQRLVTAPNGDITLILVTGHAVDNQPDAYEIHASTSTDHGATFPASTSLGNSFDYSASGIEPSAAYDAGGNLWVAWDEPGTYPLVGVVTYRVRDANGSWSDAHALSPTTSDHRIDDYTTAMSVTPQGGVTIAWVASREQWFNTQWNTNQYRVWAATKAPGESDFGPIAEVAPSNGGYRQVQAVTTGSGDVVVGWIANDQNEIQTRTLHGGSWDAAPTRVSDIGAGVGGMTLLSDGHGGAVAAWGQNVAGQVGLWASALSAGTQLREENVHVPATSLTTAPINVSAAADADLWSATAPSYEWKVDGVTVATSATATFTISTPGLHDVSVSVGRMVVARQIGVSVPGAPADADFDGTPDVSDCAPSDPKRPAKGGVDANCNGEDDAVELQQLVEKIQKEAIAKAREQAMQGFFFGAQQVIKTVPKSTPAASIAKTGAIPSTFKATGPENAAQQLSGNLDAAGRVIAPGGGNVIAAGGGNVIAPGGANVIAPGGANVIAPGGANLINATGVVAAGGMNVVAPGGANLVGRKASKKVKQVLLGAVGKRFTAAGTYKLTLKLTPAGKKAVALYRADAKKLRAKHKKVAPLKLMFTTIVGPSVYGSQPAVYSTTTFTIRG